MVVLFYMDYSGQWASVPYSLQQLTLKVALSERKPEEFGGNPLESPMQ